MYETILELVGFIVWGFICSKIIHLFWPLNSAPKPSPETPASAINADGIQSGPSRQSEQTATHADKLFLNSKDQTEKNEKKFHEQVDIPGTIPERTPNQNLNTFQEKIPDTIPEKIPEPIPERIPVTTASAINAGGNGPSQPEFQSEKQQTIITTHDNLLLNSKTLTDESEKKVPEQVKISVEKLEAVPERITEKIPDTSKEKITEKIPETINPTQDRYYDYPLSFYYIKSSHNTYLLGNQLIGESTIEAYQRAISNKVRCLELDLHDGYNGPVIYHGWTLTSKISAVDVLKDIAANYQKDDLPLILDLEDHLSDFQRNYLKREMLDIFKDSLYLQDTKEFKSLPSPNELRGKIIVLADKKKWGSLVNICQKDDHQHGDIFSNRNVTEVSSLSEHTFKGILKSLKVKIVDRIFGGSGNINLERFRDVTKRRLIRIYPGADRQFSGNYNPISALNAGCQLVALNVQTRDSHLAVYDSLFRENGNTGFVLKPATLLNPGVPADEKKNRTKTAKSADGINSEWNQTLQFDVTRSELDFLVIKVKGTQYMGLKNHTIGTHAIPIANLTEGLQTVPLEDKFLRNLNASIKVEISIKDLT
jgi:glycerophosphoryl diester phosphodiesterase